ncbi:putative white-brown complex-like protein 30, partial [Cucurbita argyrosperma subsp. sororia]
MASLDPVSAVIVLSRFPTIRCEDEDDYRQKGDPALLSSVTRIVNGRLTNMTRIISNDIGTNWGFCVKDLDSDWNGAFNYQDNIDFLTKCILRRQKEILQHDCVLQLSLDSSSVVSERGGQIQGSRWSCSVGKVKVDLKSTKFPSRTEDCQSCCEGFFCPQGLTCMIPCPLGSYCPFAKLNKTTGICDPYSYQIPPGQPNHTCGGADLWADVRSSSEIFCSPGSYCPTTTSTVTCSSGVGVLIHVLTSVLGITAGWVLLLNNVALSTILLIIYNCSDQVLTTRERRLAKRREAAARHVRETAQARERWKSAKDVAKKHATGLQEQLSQTFSRKKSLKQTDQSKGLGQLPPVHPGSSGASEQQSATSKGKRKDNNLTKMLQSIDNNPNSNEGFNLQIGDRNIKKHAPKSKQNIITHSQIFKYAYGQLEKEKAMQQQAKNLTFSGVISMATDTEIKTRPVIEIAFKDLTLTLKGKNKHIMRCVTGKLMPGRVTAVMGPSGAGKTTFLTALAGKSTGCIMTGLVLINGKPESIYSYKKIIGYVPQDDIVHGNLTVEENLRFSARCRLSADMPKPDKVLVVERVIESLGLQAVRDSLVGTVEKRGISGGQRKRVNVGLEMVMEPSLLILDEPTTGLDSASSQLLLRSLRREALEGVNICMVLHQPSYSLFKMFDDLVLLAKGGLTAYHGPVKKVEEYFAGIGITVPERVNPPDHFIDILEGLEKPKGVTREQLPVRWMLHNGYPVPPDMLKLCDFDTSASDSTHGQNTKDDAGEPSIAGNVRQDVKSNVEMQHDHFLSHKDLSNRRTPGLARQFRYFIGRVTKQRLREAKIQLTDYLMLLLAGACLGTLAKVNDETFDSLGYTFTVIAISLLCKIAALRSFSLDKLQYWRESASGISSLAHFLAKDALDLFNTIIKPLFYLSMFYFFNNPRSSFSDNYIVLVCLVYCVTGMAYAFAIYLQPAPAQLWSVLLPVVLTLIANQEKDSPVVKYLGNLCYPKWALEGFVIANAERYSGVWLITRCTSLMENGYDLHDWHRSLVMLILFGVVSRVAAFFLMITFQKK